MAKWFIQQSVANSTIYGIRFEGVPPFSYPWLKRYVNGSWSNEYGGPADAKGEGTFGVFQGASAAAGLEAVQSWLVKDGPFRINDDDSTVLDANQALSNSGLPTLPGYTGPTCPAGQHWDSTQNKCVPDTTTTPPPITGCTQPDNWTDISGWAAFIECIFTKLVASAGRLQ